MFGGFLPFCALKHQISNFLLRWSLLIFATVLHFIVTFSVVFVYFIIIADNVTDQSRQNSHTPLFMWTRTQPEIESLGSKTKSITTNMKLVTWVLGFVNHDRLKESLLCWTLLVVHPSFYDFSKHFSDEFMVSIIILKSYWIDHIMFILYITAPIKVKKSIKQALMGWVILWSEECAVCSVSHSDSHL